MDVLYLRVLDAPVRVTSEDPRWLSLLETMFEPYVVDAEEGGSQLSIAGTTGTWTFGFSGGEEAVTDDPWYLIFRMRVLLGEHALKDSPLVTLHAATAAFEGRTFAFVGSSGSGKSTLATELSELGWAFGGDEFVAFGNAGAVPLTLPAVLEGTEHWPRWSRRWKPPSWLPAPERGFAIPPRALEPWATPTQEVEIVFIRYNASSEGEIEGVSGARGLADAGGHSFLLDEVRMATLADVFRKVEARSMTYPSTRSALEMLRASYGISPA